MLDDISPIATAAGCALIGAILIPLLARLIPARAELSWRAEVSESSAALEHPFDPKRFELSLVSSGSIAALAIAVSGLAFLWGTTSTSVLALAVYFLSLLLLAAIDTRHGLLPDAIVFPAMWIGLVYYAAVGDPSTNILGACAAYLVPSALVLIVRLKSEVDLLGRGDLKCFAMAGAWLGLEAVPLILLSFTALAMLKVVLQSVLSKRALPLHSGILHLAASVAVVAWGSVF